MESLFSRALDSGVFPGAAVAISVGLGEERRTLFQYYGNTAYQSQGDGVVPVCGDTYYDLASLTKPLATLPALLLLLREGRIGWDQPLAELLEREIPADKRDIRLHHLLGHSSGVPAYIKFFESSEIIEEYQNQGREQKVSGESTLNLILSEPLLYQAGCRSLYSDLGFMLAGFIVELKSGKNLADYLTEKIYRPLGIAEKIFFNPVGRPHKMVDYAPGEYCRWRRRLLRGEVGDENCALLGGVAGHAGLFATVGAVARVLEHYFDLWLGRGDGPALCNREDLIRCFSRQRAIDTTWALGVDTPSLTNSSGGRLLSPGSVGHLGYSGTSFWLDPERELIMVLLSNRVHPSRFNEQIKRFRPLFHERVVIKYKELLSCIFLGED